MPDGTDRRDVSRDITDIKVSIARIETLSSTQGTVLSQIQAKLELGVFREEYERRHKEVEQLVNQALRSSTEVLQDTAVLRGQIRVWRFVSGATIGLLGAGVGVLYFLRP